MLAPDILQLRQFYATPFGDSVRGVVADLIAKMWKSAEGDVMLGMGYATPYLAPYLGQATPLIACMPPAQGAEYWPQEQDNLVLMTHDSELPFSENSINRILLIHSVENSEQLSNLIQEIWRVLTPSGKLLAIVPNRRGMWARSHLSPFGHGRPFNIAQMRELLAEQNFTITNTRTALFLPPLRIKCLWNWAMQVEKIGRFICQILGVFGGGLLLVEAEKQVYATIRQPVVEARNYRGVLAGTRPAIATRKNL
jgi:SAM-dependent methyltransferase